MKPIYPDFTASFVRVKKKVTAPHSILLVGLPGVGFASKLAVDHLVKQLKAERIATIYSPHFPNQVVATPKGNLRQFLLKFYYKNINGKKLFFLTGDLQPLTVEGQYEVAAKALQFFSEAGGEAVYSMAGLVTHNVGQDRSIHLSSTHKAQLEQLKKTLLLKINSAYIPIVGMAGLLPTLAPLYRLKGNCLLVETTGEAIDAVAAVKLVETVGKMVKAKIPVVNLHRKAQAAKSNIEKMSKQVAQEQQAQQAVFPGAAPAEIKDALSYIR